MNSFIKVDVLSPLGLSFDKSRVLYIRWFWRPFFEQVVFALGVLVVPSVSDVIPVLRGAFASSTKYLRQSSWPYLAAVVTQLSFTHQISFFLRRNISRCLSDHCLLPVVPHLLPYLAKVSLCRKEIEDSRGVLLQQLAYTTLLHHTGNH